MANAILVGITEVLLWTSMRSPGGQHHPDKYYILDLICQCCYTVLGGYLCCVVAGPDRRAALFGMISLGWVIGGLSMPSSCRVRRIGTGSFCSWCGALHLGWLEAQISARHHHRSASSVIYFRSIFASHAGAPCSWNLV